MKERHLIGFSLSACVYDICRGAVDIEEVLFIHTGCLIENEQDLEEVFESYSQGLWSSFPDKAREVVQKLMTDIDGPFISWASKWPRKAAPFVGWGHWLSTKNAIRP